MFIHSDLFNSAVISEYVYCVLPLKKSGVSPSNFTKVLVPALLYLNDDSLFSITKLKSIDETSLAFIITYFLFSYGEFIE